MEDTELPKKAKTHKGKVYLNSLLPKLIEDPKQCLFINTKTSSELMRMVLNDLYLTRKDYSKKLNQKEEISNLLQSKSDVEYLCDKNNCALFTYTTDQKKKPMNLVMGLLYNKSLLDAFEFEVVNFIPISYFDKKVEVDSYMKPILLFQGEIFESDPNYERLKKFFIDYFRLYDTDATVISDLRRVIVISCDEKTDKVVKLRSYQIKGQINEENISKIDLEEIGPSIDMKERKIELADNDVYGRALKQPKGVRETKEKNIEKNALGEKRGRIHMMKQNLNAMALRKFKRQRMKKKFNKKEDSNVDINEERNK